MTLRNKDGGVDLRRGDHIEITNWDDSVSFGIVLNAFPQINLVIVAFDDGLVQTMSYEWLTQNAVRRMTN